MRDALIREATDLGKSFRGFDAVRGTDLRVRRGTIHALIGPNGAGRTTCFDLLTRRQGLVTTPNRPQCLRAIVAGRAWHRPGLAMPAWQPAGA